MSFDDSFTFGKFGEGLVGRWLRRRNWHLLSINETDADSDYGPRIICPDGRELVAPDCLAFQADIACWMEVKSKSHCAWNRQRRIWVAGIDRRYFNHYVAVRKRGPFGLLLMFLIIRPTPSDDDRRNGCPAECPTGLFCGEILRLNGCINHESDKSGMVYWAVSDLLKLAPLEDVVPAQQGRRFIESEKAEMVRCV